jgi:hypothetical protein
LEDGPLELPEPERGGEPPPEAANAPVPLEAAAAAPPPPKDGDQLVIPDDPTDLGFLEGCWKSDSGMRDRIEGMPMYAIYCFDKEGKASHSIEMMDSSNKRVRRTCNSSAKATVKGKQLRIRAQSARCGGSRMTFVPSTIQCTYRSASAAVCTFQSDGFGKSPTRITRRGS